MTRSSSRKPRNTKRLASGDQLHCQEERARKRDQNRRERHRFVTALTFGELMESRLGPLGIDFDEIEGAWLRVRVHGSRRRVDGLGLCWIWS